MKVIKLLLKIFLILALLALAIIIFKFSAQPANVSDALSNDVTKRLIRLYQQFTGTDLTEAMYTVKELNRFVRKYAHFLLYSALGAVTVLMFGAVIFRKWHFPTWLCSFMFCILYAVSDEYHQSFVPGRGAMLSDIILDSLGAFWSSVLVFFVCKLISYISIRIKKRRYN